MLNVDNIEVGERYHVQLEDCCVTGHFDARVAIIYYYDGGEGKEPEKVVFDNGVVLDTFYGVSFEPIESEEEKVVTQVRVQDYTGEWSQWKDAE